MSIPSPMLELQTYTLGPIFMYLLGSEVSSLCLHGKYFFNLAIPPPTSKINASENLKLLILFQHNLQIWPCVPFCRYSQVYLKMRMWIIANLYSLMLTQKYILIIKYLNMVKKITVFNFGIFHPCIA